MRLRFLVEKRIPRRLRFPFPYSSLPLASVRYRYSYTSVTHRTGTVMHTFASVQFHIDMRRFQSEVELLKTLDFYEAPFVAGDVAVVVCIIKVDFTFDDSPQIFFLVFDAA